MMKAAPSAQSMAEGRHFVKYAFAWMQNILVVPVVLSNTCVIEIRLTPNTGPSELSQDYDFQNLPALSIERTERKFVLD